MTSPSISADALPSISSEEKVRPVTSNKIETVVARLEERITRGEWGEGGSLPPQSQFAREYGVSLGTIAIAFRSLHKKGRINLEPYKGATVAGADTNAALRGRRQPLIALRGSYVQSEHNYRAEGDSASLVGGVIRAADAEHCPLLLLPKSPDGEAYGVSYYRAKEIKGAIFLGGESSGEALMLRQEGFPVLLANRPIGPTPLNYIDYDHSDSLRKAVELFHDQGHRRIAVISPPTTNPGYYNSLLPEFLALLAEKRNFYDTTDYWLALDRQQVEKSESLIERLLSLPEPPTAILCFNPGLVVQVMTVARKMRLRIPEDLSLLGSCFAVAAEAPVSGFVLPHKELGKSLLQAMCTMIENPFFCVQKQLAPLFVDRYTVGPVKVS